MEDIDIPYLCRVIGDLTAIPVRYDKGGVRLFYYSLLVLPRDPLVLNQKEMEAIKGHVGYFFTPDFYYYGIVARGDEKIVIGPSTQTRQSDQRLREMAFSLDVPPDEVPTFLSSMKQFVTMPFNSLLQVLCTVNYVLNGEKLELSDILIGENAQQRVRQTMNRETAMSLLEDRPLHGSQAAPVHNSLAFEERLANIIRRGDTAALLELLGHAPALRPGVMAATHLRQTKNVFIVSTAIASRAAIRGGLDVDDAFALSDAYIQKCELLMTPESIMSLQYEMVFDYAKKVESLLEGADGSKLVKDVRNFIRHHLSEPIKTSDIAKALYISRSRLSSKFKEESGVTLIDFIHREKIEEAKRLLLYTDKTALSIAEYLGFSSQSHFTSLFRRYAGVPPLEYRKKAEESKGG